jgi:uncharacterized protein YjbI with pentapeptide repeats
MTGAHFSRTLNANYSLQVGGDLLMESKGQNMASFQNVFLSAAKIAGRISMVGASFNGTLEANSLQVGGDLLMFSDDKVKASFKDVFLDAAKVKGRISMHGVSFVGKLYASAMEVGGDLDMQWNPNKASFEVVVLTGSKITGQIFMGGAGFDCKIDAFDLQVGGYLDLRGATLAGLDLSGSSISQDLVVGEPGRVASWLPTLCCPEQTRGCGDLNLRNAHVGNLVETKDGWPKGHLHLDGFTFNHVGGFRGGDPWSNQGMDAQDWDDWTKNDPKYSPVPYAQLAAALTAQGRRDGANDIRYRGRVRERENTNGMCKVLVWTPSICRRFRYRHLHIRGSSVRAPPFPRRHSFAMVDCPGG